MEKQDQKLQTNISKELLKKSLTLVETPLFKDGNKLSIYTGSLTLDVFLRQLDRLRKVFKGLDNNWADVLRERLKANQFTDERLIDAVDNLFDKFKFGHTPNIAEIIDFDKTIEVITYRKMLELLREDDKVFDRYTVVDIEGQPKYVLREYQKQHNLKLFKFEGKKKEIKYPDITDEEKLATAKIMRDLIEKMNVSELKKKKKTNVPKFNNKNSGYYLRAKEDFQKALIAEELKTINTNID
jgi:hypothetical protein